MSPCPARPGERRAVPAAFFALTTGLTAFASPAVEAAVVVEEVEPGGVAESAGLHAGDLLLAWSQPAALNASDSQSRGGTLLWPFDLLLVSMEEAPRGTVTLQLRRGGTESSVDLGPGLWRLRTRPVLEAGDEEAYRAAISQLQGSEVGAGMKALETLASAAAERGDPLLAAWLLHRAARRPHGASMWEHASKLYDAAVGHLRAASEEPPALQTAYEALLREAQGDLLLEVSRHREAERAHRAALELRRRSQTGDGLGAATSLMWLGDVALSSGDLDAAESLYRQSLEVRERLAPESLVVADCLNGFGRIAFNRGDLTAAEQYHRRALVVRSRLAPESLVLVGSLGNLGAVAYMRGELRQAGNYWQRALRIEERFAPQSLSLARLSINLGLVAQRRGDLSGAEKRHLEALAISELLAPDSLIVARALSSLGLVAWHRGDFEGAGASFSRSLEIQERLAPGSSIVAYSLNNLSEVARRAGDLSEAADYLERALEIRRRLSPDSLPVATSLRGLGAIAAARGEVERAEAYHRQALEIREATAPDSLEVADSLQHLGELALARRDLGQAIAHAERALHLRQRLAPRSSAVAESATTLARAHRLRGPERAADPDRALALLRQAVGALEAQEGRLGGVEEDRLTFRSRSVGTYRELIDLLLELGRGAEAFHVAEQSRARRFLAMLAERDVVFDADVPAELERRRRGAAAEYERVQGTLRSLSPQQASERVETLLARLELLDRRRAEIREEIRQSSPRLAGLRYPEPLDLGAVQRSLDPGTAILSFSVSEQATHLFVVGGVAGLRILRLPIGEGELSDQVARFRRAIEEEGREAELEPNETSPGRTLALGSRLYRDLVAPAEEEIASAQRLLVIPDGPLHTLPFAALVRPAGEAEEGSPRRSEYLVEWKPLHVAVSLTVYDELRRNRGRPPGSGLGGLLAFGDPDYSTRASIPATATAESVLRAPQGSLPPLPATRDEVEAIVRLFGPAATAHLGAEATEERAKEVPRSTRLLHFAAHGTLDERFPLSSAIALSTPDADEGGRENGLLQAWEILEEVRLDAELVVLSACQSGLGQEAAGEGLIGLTRAFHYAGARSVLASLWSVSDASTAVLMARFYANLKAGRTKDEALRAAQLDLIQGRARGASGTERGVGGRAPRRERSASHPFFWAPFVLSGDWR